MLLRPPSDFVYVYKNPRHNEIKKRLMPKIEQACIDYPDELKSKDWHCTIVSSFHKELDIFDDDTIHQIVWEACDNMFMETPLSYTPKHSTLQKIWFNRYETGQFQEVHAHDHGSTSFSGIYLLDVSGPNETVFSSITGSPFLQWQIDTSKNENIREGCTLIFPSTLQHFVNPVSTDRTSIAFNIQSNFS